MAQIQKGETFGTGQSVTATRLNAHVDAAVILPGAVSEQATTAPATGDRALLYDISAPGLISPTLLTILDLQVKDTAAATASMRTLGFTGNKAAPGVGTPGLANDNTYTGKNTFVHVGGTTGLTILSGAGLGTGGSPAATLITGSTDLYGRIQLVSGSTPANGTLATITFNDTFTAAPFVIMVGYDNNGIALQAGTSRLRVSSATTTTFVLSNGVNLQASTTYIFSYLAFGL